MAAIGSLELPQCLIVAGTLLVIAGLIGRLISRRQLETVQDIPDSVPRSEPRPQMPPLPDLLESRPRRNRRTPNGELPTR